MRSGAMRKQKTVETKSLRCAGKRSLGRTTTGPATVRLTQLSNESDRAGAAMSEVRRDKTPLHAIRPQRQGMRRGGGAQSCRGGVAHWRGQQSWSEQQSPAASCALSTPRDRWAMHRPELCRHDASRRHDGGMRVVWKGVTGAMRHLPSDGVLSMPQVDEQMELNSPAHSRPGETGGPRAG